ncbi:MAG: tRNA pseudouridine synthase [Akkermansiaceae bacterium]|nr:tRNA pseudouridine synthase [Akkermansiaceae bacterium]
MPLHILYQDETLVAIDKPAGLLVHPGREPEPPEMIAMKVLRDQLGKHIIPIHRLDRPTSGVLLFAFDKQTSTMVQKDFATREVEKTYLAVVEGRTADEWRCDAELQKGPDEPWLDALTFFKRRAVSDAFAGEPDLVLSLVQAEPHSGRFHQIRKHLHGAGLPIVGDFRYAGEERCEQLGELLGTGSRMLLQAKTLEFTHPYSLERIRIEAPTDPEIRRCFPALPE